MPSEIQEKKKTPSSGVYPVFGLFSLFTADTVKKRDRDLTAELKLAQIEFDEYCNIVRSDINVMINSLKNYSSYRHKSKEPSCTEAKFSKEKDQIETLAEIKRIEGLTQSLISLIDTYPDLTLNSKRTTVQIELINETLTKIKEHHRKALAIWGDLTDCYTVSRQEIQSMKESLMKVSLGVAK